MKVKIAKYAGFCFGVKRAVSIVENSGKKYDNVVTYGPIIHNPQVVERLRKDGIDVVNSICEVANTMYVVIRSHGVEKGEMVLLEKKAAKVIDAACPFVEKAQKKAKELSSLSDILIILGEKAHPEVKGILSYTNGNVLVISSVEEAKELDFIRSYGLIAQTTQNSQLFDNISEVLSKKCEILNKCNTICNATNQRQEASIELAKEVDIMIVVGGKNSANTTRLYHLCKDICKDTYHIETMDELNKKQFDNVKIVGVTAGASTPYDVVEKVREYILEVNK